MACRRKRPLRHGHHRPAAEAILAQGQSGVGASEFRRSGAAHRRIAGKHGNVSAQQKQTELQLEASGDLFPNIPLHVEKLRVMDMDVALDVRRVISAPYLSVHAIKARVKINDGKADVDPLRITLAGGVASGSMMLDARNDIPKGRRQPTRPSTREWCSSTGP
jgi:uncharacterized protein involved in outer membrane biogenesis